MYKNEWDVDGMSMDALMAIMSRRLFDYTQLKKKIAQVKHFKDVNSYEIGGAFKYKNSAKVHYAQSQEEINRVLGDLERGE